MDGQWVTFRRALLIVVAALAIVFLIAPGLLILPMGFSASRILQFPPEGFSLEWYGKMFSDTAWTSGFIHSLQVALLTSLAATVLGTSAALGLVRGHFPGKGIVTGLLLMPLIVPSIVVAVGMFAVYVRWHITGTPLGLAIGHTCLALPFVVINVSVSLQTVDRSLEMAAQGLGASPVRTFQRITLPLILPGILTGALFAFITSWDEVVVAIFLTTARYSTLPVVMWTQMRQEVDPTVAAVASVLLAVTTILLLMVFGRRGSRRPA